MRPAAFGRLSGSAIDCPHHGAACDRVQRLRLEGAAYVTSVRPREGATVYRELGADAAVLPCFRRFPNTVLIAGIDDMADKLSEGQEVSYVQFPSLMTLY